MYIIERVQDKPHPKCYRVAHYIESDSRPTQTADLDILRSLPDAMTVALGKAAKQSIIQGGKPIIVRFDRDYTVIATVD